MDKIEIESADGFTLAFLPWRSEKETNMIQLVVQGTKQFNIRK